MRLFFSRRIGLSDNGEAIADPGRHAVDGPSGRLLDRRAEHSAAIEAGAVPATNFTALRVRRDIFANSDIGAMLLNKEVERAALQPRRRPRCQLPVRALVSLNAYGAKTFSPAAAVPSGAGDDYTTRAGRRYDGRAWQFNGRYDTIGARFNDEMGFVPRLGVDNAFVFAGRRFRPRGIVALGSRDAAALAGRRVRPPGRRRTGIALSGFPLAHHLPGRFEHGGGRESERRGRSHPVHDQQRRAACA